MKSFSIESFSNFMQILGENYTFHLFSLTKKTQLKIKSQRNTQIKGFIGHIKLFSINRKSFKIAEYYFNAIDFFFQNPW